MKRLYAEEQPYYCYSNNDSEMSWREFLGGGAKFCYYRSMTREEAIKILNENLTNRNMVKHCLASGAVMKALAERLCSEGLARQTRPQDLNEYNTVSRPVCPRSPSDDFDGEVLAWEICGLLHDADAESTTPEDQGAAVGRWFLPEGKYAGQLPGEYADSIIHAMAAHNEMTGTKCESATDWALYAGEKLTGLIVATALVLPSKKLADVTADMVLRRFKEKSFAKGAKRENILQCEKAGVGLEDLVAVSLSAMKSISDELGL